MKEKVWEMENNHTISEERNEMLEIPTTVIYRKNISQCSKSFLIDTLLSKNDPPADEVQSPECKRLKEINETKVKVKI